ncbi:hypothetical protein AKO1_001219, partial [Acrasis kona]
LDEIESDDSQHILDAINVDDVITSIQNGSDIDLKVYIKDEYSSHIRVPSTKQLPLPPPLQPKIADLPTQAKNLPPLPTKSLYPNLPTVEPSKTSSLPPPPKPSILAAKSSTAPGLPMEDNTKYLLNVDQLVQTV